MGALPVPAKTFFQDFAFDLLTYTIERDSKVVATAEGLRNSDEDGKHIAFLIGPDIEIGDVLISSTGEKFIVKHIGYDTYNGQPELIKAYY